MDRYLFLLALISACGDDGPTAHDVVECDSSWDAAKSSYPNDVVTCERACEERPPDAPGGSCFQEVDGISCPSNLVATELDGTRGCCAPAFVSSGELRIKFFECAD